MSFLPHQIEEAIADTVARLEHGQVVTAKAEAVYMEARRDYDLSMAHALLRAEGPNQEARKAAAVIATREERLRMDVAELAWRDAQGRMRVLRDKLDGMRSIGSSVRAALGSS